MRIPLSAIKPSPRPVRSTRDEAKMDELAASIKEQGLIVPVKVRPDKDAKYCIHHGWAAFSDEYEPDCIGCDAVREKYPVPFELVYGHRRIEAARRAGLAEVEAIVEGVDDTNALVQALIENIQREDMEPLDKARAIKAVLDETNWSISEFARRGIMNRLTANDYLRLLRLPEEAQALITGDIGVKHVAQVAGLDAQHQVASLRKATDEQLTGEQTRRVAESIAAAATEQAKEMLLETPYSPFIHDPEMVRSRPAHDPIYREEPPTRQQQQQQSADVVAAAHAFIDAAGYFDNLIAQARKSLEADKMSPEARQFIAHKLRQTVTKIENFIAELEA